MNPMISVVTICYNIQDQIEKTLRSVIFQSYQDIEYIIIDGASKDNTVNIIKKYVDIYPNRISYWCSETDNGIYDAMNKGIIKATGDYIIFMNGGDIFYNNDVISTVFSNNPGITSADVIFGGKAIINHEKIEIIPTNPFYHSTDKIKYMGISHQAIFLRTQYAKKYRFNTKFKITADYDMIKKVYDSGAIFKEVKIPICIYDTNGISIVESKKTFIEVAQICGLSKCHIHFIIILRKICTSRFYRNVRPLLQKLKLLKSIKP